MDNTDRLQSLRNHFSSQSLDGGRGIASTSSDADVRAFYSNPIIAPEALEPQKLLLLDKYSALPVAPKLTYLLDDPMLFISKSKNSEHALDRINAKLNKSTLRPLRRHMYSMAKEAIEHMADLFPDESAIRQINMAVFCQVVSYGGEQVGIPQIHMDGQTPLLRKAIANGCRVPHVVMGTPFPTPAFPDLGICEMKQSFKYKTGVGYAPIVGSDGVASYQATAAAPGQYSLLPEFCAHASPSPLMMPKSYAEAEELFAGSPDVLACFGPKGYQRMFVSVDAIISP